MADHALFVKGMPSSKERRLRFLHQEDPLADCEFLVGDKTAKQKPRRYRCHKMILATASEVFERMFYGSFNVVEPIKVTEVSPITFERFLRYVYVYDFDGENLSATKELAELFYLADKYMMQDLTDAIVGYLKHDHKWSLGDVWPIYDLACLHESLPLVLRCYQEINKFQPSLFENNTFYQVNPGHLKRLVIFLGQRPYITPKRIWQLLEKYEEHNKLYKEKNSEDFLKLVDAASKLDFNKLSKDDLGNGPIVSRLFNIKS